MNYVFWHFQNHNISDADNNANRLHFCQFAFRRNKGVRRALPSDVTNIFKEKRCGMWSKAIIKRSFSQLRVIESAKPIVTQVSILLKPSTNRWCRPKEEIQELHFGQKRMWISWEILTDPTLGCLQADRVPVPGKNRRKTWSTPNHFQLLKGNRLRSWYEIFTPDLTKKDLKHKYRKYRKFMQCLLLLPYQFCNARTRDSFID